MKRKFKSIYRLTTEPHYFMCNGYFFQRNTTTTNFISVAGSDITNWIQKHKKKYENTVFIDVGANIGAISMFASDYFSKVVSFEPMNENIAIFEESMILQKKTNITIERVALSDEGGLEYMTFDYDNSKLSNNGRVVRTKQGDVYGFQNVGLIKIDVEGAEWFVLKGFLETIENQNPDLIIENNGQNAKDYLKIEHELQCLGYERIKTEKFNDYWVKK